MTWNYGLYIDGKEIPSGTSGVISVLNPANEEVIGTVPDSTADDAHRAISAARRAFDDGPWPWMTPGERGRIIKRMAEILTERHPELHELIVSETGAIASGNNMGTVDFIQCAGAVDAVHWYGDNLHNALDWVEMGIPTGGVNGIGGSAVVREPAGVVAVITPFNFPFQLNLFKTIPAIAAGCTVVLKPHPWTPLDAYEIARAATDAGVPPGVVNVVTGGAEIGNVLTSSPYVDVVTFTGSTNTGRHIMANAASTIKRVKLELGGKSARVVLGDVSEEYAATIGFADVLAHCGQACVVQSRLLLPERLREAYVSGVQSAYDEVRIGDPRDPTTTLGPLIRSQQRDRVEKLVQSGVDEGATVLVGGKRPEHLSRGFFYEPTVLMDARSEMQVAQEEIFGPVLTVICYDGEDSEAIRLANDTIYGLAGGVVSANTTRAYNVARKIRAGYISVQTEVDGAVVEQGSDSDQGPGWGRDRAIIGTAGAFGGFKQSGFGREWGSHGLAEFTELKSLTWS
ncbi:aldehyde dehydrogenase family protein [Rhodococcus globerulus]|uniref:Aldehyde dehydrogenase family protein n=1 Tax=Rhodococcus globerulus TaxID=33008 RepID=A0ABU4C5F2_RHOGO|nr:aldehyde dehydrogenase family protein [Rhodococcus globerulus]MDV6271418.1 aldehyde dehydrogenase family protein [Rhodococcus globerulus]